MKFPHLENNNNTMIKHLQLWSLISNSIPSSNLSASAKLFPEKVKNCPCEKVQDTFLLFKTNRAMRFSQAFLQWRFTTCKWSWEKSWHLVNIGTTTTILSAAKITIDRESETGHSEFQIFSWKKIKHTSKLMRSDVFACFKHFTFLPNTCFRNKLRSMKVYNVTVALTQPQRIEVILKSL